MKNLFLLLSLCFSFSVLAQNDAGFNINIKINNFAEKELYLAYHYGDKQYIRDTVDINADGTFSFAGEEPLEGGIYLVVLPPNNNYFQILVSEDDQNYSLETNVENLVLDMKVEGSFDNQLFNTYLQYLAGQRPDADRLRKAIEEAAGNETEKERLQKELDAIDQKVMDYQQKLMKDHPNTLTASIIKANLPMDLPEFSGTEDEQQEQKWRYMQKNYFKNLDLGDPRMLRTPYLFQRIDYFVNKLQIQHPDTLSQAIDEVLEKAAPAEETFKYYLIHFLNYYAQSKIVGMDAVYVHLVEKYYKTGKAPWTEEEQLQKIIENSDALKPLLIGKIAPDIQLEDKNGKKTALHEVDSEYTILYFWRYDCGHCKKSTPHLKEFYEKYKSKGVKIFAVCSKFTDEIPPCWEYIDENEIGDWMHMVDPYHRSRFSKIYNIKSTPQLYILDRNKEIISKRIGAEQLEEVMDQIIEMNKKEKENPSGE